MSGKQPLRRSGRQTKQETFGQDFAMENPSKRSRKEPDPVPRKEPDPPLPQLPTPGQSEPIPGTSTEDLPGTTPGGGDADLVPTSPFKWSSDPENW